MGNKVLVTNDIDKAIKKFRRIITENNVLKDYYDHRYYEKPSKKRRRKENIKKFKAMLWQKEQDKLLER